METTKIEITDEALRKGAEEGMDGFIKVFTDKYLEVTGGVINAETMPLLNGYQHSLLGYHFLREEINEGGFVQLIQNGYGPYIFENPFAKAMRLFGAKDLSKLVYDAKKIYDANRADLEKECDDDEFMAMYEQYEAFDDLEEAFMDMEELITAQIAEYVDNNIEQFADIINKE
ncbi:DMP19 family protein [Phocaeicola sp.]